MPLLSQSRFPRLWLLMQKTIGGNACKQQFAIEHYRGQSKVLEIGCSVGNISSVFQQYAGISFTGIDIDASALALAQKRFRRIPNFRFMHRSLQDLASDGERFDYVIFAGILHHVDDATGEKLLRDALTCTSPDGYLVIYDPEATQEHDKWLVRWFEKLLEQGAHLRTKTALEALALKAGVVLEQVESRMVSPGIVRRPYVARFSVLLGRAPGTDAT
jgi:2-polyprenyl-3-methyl-5-hydroxy-6-metoxy-1,4-benzoquinol methylase